jgi:GNAT superfamily N-acetyltransferase
VNDLADIVYRQARPEDAGAISALALRSKAHWGYSADFMAACRGDLTIRPEWCDGHSLCLAELDGRLLGYSRLSGGPPLGMLEGLFVDPAAMGQGVGRALLQKALDQAAREGIGRLTIDSDPYAEPFYLRCGAVRVGETRSTVFPDRVLPQLEIAV